MVPDCCGVVEEFPRSFRRVGPVVVDVPEVVGRVCVEPETCPRSLRIAGVDETGVGVTVVPRTLPEVAAGSPRLGPHDRTVFGLWGAGVNGCPYE